MQWLARRAWVVQAAKLPSQLGSVAAAELASLASFGIQLD